MRHGDKVNNLGRTAAHRRAMLANMAISLIEHKRITTTLAKAKALRKYAEPLITKSKDNTTHSRRLVFSYLQNKEAIKELFSTVAEKIGDRPGGYLRVIKLGFRRGDGAETAIIEFVDFNEVYNPNAGKVKQTKKTRRGGKKSAVAAVAAAPLVGAVAVEEAIEAVADEPAVDEVVAQAEETVERVEAAAAAAEETVAEAAEEASDAPADTPAEEEKKDEEQA